MLLELVIVFSALHSLVFVSCNVLVFINNDLNESSKLNADRLKADLLEQAQSLQYKDLVVVVAHDAGHPYGYWTMFPLFPILHKKFKNTSWFFFCEDSTQIHLARLLAVLSRYSPTEHWFLGHGLRDRAPAITHHFAFINDPSQFAYPDFDAGWAVSAGLMDDVIHRLKTKEQKIDFTIDVKHEVAMFMYNDEKGTKLTDLSEFCVNKQLEDSSCATAIHYAVPNCGAVNSDHILVAVKTCKKFHADRMPIILNTIGKHAKHIRYYSDEVDSSIPTEYIDVANTERGHCQKLYNIIKKSTEPEWKDIKWLVVIDDDTIMNYERLRRVLACYDPHKPLLMGERYGYALARGYGYEYITGGGGMILSSEAVRRLLSSGHRCGSPDQPDDMWLGMSFGAMRIPQVNLKHLHQAPPSTYASDFLAHRYLVSFHKHYDVKPMDVYRDYLGNGAVTDDAKGNMKEEL